MRGRGNLTAPPQDFFFNKKKVLLFPPTLHRDHSPSCLRSIGKVRSLVDFEENRLDIHQNNA
mgnify:CR=1 FL=1